MAQKLMPDAFWARIAPLFPPEPPKPKGGRPRVSDRAALTGMLFVLKTGIPWEHLPAEMGCESGMMCWRRLRPHLPAFPRLTTPARENSRPGPPRTAPAMASAILERVMNHVAVGG